MTDSEYILKLQSQFQQMFDNFLTMEKLANKYRMQRDENQKEIDRLKNQMTMLRNINQTLNNKN